MTATIHGFPQHRYRPDAAKIGRILKAAGGNERALFMLAMAGLDMVQEAPRTMSGPQLAQRVANGLGITYLAVAELLGVPREDAEGDLPPAG